MADDPTVIVIRVPLDKAYVGQVWRYVRGQVLAELFAKGWHPQNPDLSGLLMLVQNAFPDWSSSGRRGVLSVFGNKTASQDLTERLELFAQKNEFAYELQQVLPRMWQPDTVALATAWLRGKTLSDDGLRKLGLPTSYPNDFEQEQTARDVVTSLCRLAAGTTTLVVCFDEVEALISGGDDTAALRAFTTLVTDLIAEPGPRVVVTFIRPDTLLTLRKNVEHSNLQKMSQTEAAISPLEWEHVVQLFKARLHADPLCRAERAKQAVEQYWPFNEEYLRELYARERLVLTPRHLIIACRVEFDRLQKDAATPPLPIPPKTTVEPSPGLKPGPTPVAPKPGTGVPPPPKKPESPDLLRQLWDKRRAHHLTHLQALTFDSTMGNGLRWLARITAAPFETSDATDSRIGDVSLVFKPTTPGGKPVGVSFCHQEPQSLWRRLDRLINQAQAAKAHNLLGRLILVRAADPPLSNAASDRVEKIRRGGAVAILIPKEQLADLAAFQELQSKSQTGGITDFGRPIDADRFDTWAKENLTPAVKELADAIFGPAPVSSPPVAVPVPVAPPVANGKATPVKPEPGDVKPVAAKPVPKQPAKKK